MAFTGDLVFMALLKFPTMCDVFLKAPVMRVAHPENPAAAVSGHESLGG